jgi:hypothetical protein
MLGFLLFLAVVRGATVSLPRYKELKIRDDLPIIQTCSFDFPNPFTLVSLLVNSQIQGLSYSDVLQISDFLNEQLNLAIANVSVSDIPDVLQTANICNTTDFWINAYGGVLPPFGCSWTMNNQSDIYSSINGCENQIVPMMARLNYIRLVNTSTTATFPVIHRSTIATVITTFTETSSTSVTQSTKYEFDDITITKTVRKFHRDEKAQNVAFVQCPFMINNFNLVHNLGPVLGETGQIMCETYEAQLANITGPILLNLNEVFTNCMAGFAIFSQYNGYQPLCGAASANGIIMNDLSDAFCTNFSNATWAICHYGLPVETTITVSTDPSTLWAPIFEITTRSVSVTAFVETTTTTTETEFSYLTTFTFTNLHTTTVTRNCK